MKTTDFDTKRFYINILQFLGIGLFWTLLDIVLDTTTDLTDLIILAFFLVWNSNVCQKTKKAA